MLKRYQISAFSVNELLAVLVAVCIFLSVLVIGFLGGLQDSKREFEVEAQNIAAVLRGGISVADGVVTSLDAAGYGATDQNDQKLNSHFASVLGNYDYVSGLGRFAGIEPRQRQDKARNESNIEASTSPVQQLATNGDTSSPVNTAEVNTAESPSFPILNFKSRFGASQADVDLTGFDLASAANTRTTVVSAGSIGRTLVTSVPESWKRTGELLVFRLNSSESSLNKGFFLELDLDAMAASGGVETKNFDIELTMFSQQGEFESDSQSQNLYQQTAQVDNESILANYLDDNRYLKSFSVGDKTLLLEVSGATGLSERLVAMSVLVASLLSLMFLSIVQLIKKRRHAQRLQEREAEKLYRANYRAAVTLASIDDGVLTTDVDNRVLSANEAAEQLLGYSESEMQGKVVDSVVVYSSKDKMAPFGERLILRSADGSRRYVNKKQSYLKGIEGELSGHVLVLRDVSVEHSLTQELQHKVNHDSLTGLSNRLHFESRVQQLFEDENLSEPGHVLCFIDLDRFKEVNDTCGHDAGDELLVTIADAFTKNVRDNDMVARLGGDEFGILLQHCARDDARQVTDRIQEYFQSFYFDYDGHVFPVRCSIGFVHFHPQNCNSDDVLKSADAACFDAKHRGRNSVCERAVGDSAKKSDQISQWLPKLKLAIEEEKFTLLLQSVVSLTDRTVSSHEVYLRLIDDDGSLISPNQFMNSAKRYEMAETIDRWVVKTTLQYMCDLAPQYKGDKFAINLTSQALESGEFIDYICERVQQSGIDPSRLCFDIKESDLLSKPASAEGFCKALRNIGCEVALDDFGATMTSFSLLKSLPLNTLKIDGSLISGMRCVDSYDEKPAADRALVSAINSFASSMGLSTIAEQVEDTACLEALTELKVDYAQGAAVADLVFFSEFLMPAPCVNNQVNDGFGDGANGDSSDDSSDDGSDLRAA